MLPEERLAGTRATVLLLAVVAVCCLAVFMTVGANGQWDFVLPFRARKAATMALVGFAVAVSTVLFQTITQNRILTPAIMGFDSFYVLLHTVLLFMLGSSTLAKVDPRLLFVLHVGLMLAFTAVLRRWFFSGTRHHLELLGLAGIVVGILFRNASAFLQRLIDPNEFVFLQDRFFATFNNPDQGLLLVSGVVTLGVSLYGVRLLPACDALVLGREAAISVGVSHDRVVARVLMLVTLLVSISTALVGPVTFFGLLVANLAYVMLRTYRHALLLPGVALLAVSLLLIGQVILERVLGFDASLRVVIEFFGGVAFIVLMLKGAKT
ncbi:iron chelate uptake ABC transporter family permease subunit [Hyalangium versicolor]|uniref:iron chelate uptake ABC transporter family permease subunit n=1 Tax=Hyalangium versicolor TaxID=2861190 RepID=UPI001CCD4A42|nr:iron chelate uptake ABC transporter family permease subunit [Hyalangium versicolor]